MAFSLALLFSPLMVSIRGLEHTLETPAIDNCDYSVQRHIYNSQPQCIPRRTMVDLRQYFVDVPDIIQVNS